MDGLGFCIEPVHNKVISGFKALRQAGAPMAGLEPATEGSLQISGRTHKPLCHRRPLDFVDISFVSTGKRLMVIHNSEFSGQGVRFSQWNDIIF
ncbi:hypothetical protein PoB_003421100 [Plakobranchus ocellatus]|uniref:Uncharacterized protein n=1 Tax=Plakobranchus ocellatus TaxID=259542 RepID=A0AAV4A928_9GAST|nr:hypothetical protein PoB_003421100 [Plakobranchus ocellatus]